MPLVIYLEGDLRDAGTFFRAAAPLSNIHCLLLLVLWC